MACFRPQAVQITWNNLTQKNDLKFIKKVDKYTLNLHWKDYDFISCGKCVGCRLSHAKEWAARCQLEASQYEHNYFITFTYSDDYLPEIINDDNEALATLYDKDMIKFINSLRRHFFRRNHIGIRYLGSGEYGGRTGRPHYHYIFFNLPLYDLKPFGANKLGQRYYVSELVKKLWGKGHVLIGSFSYETAGYVARYTSKKITYNGLPTQDDPIDKIRKKEFLRMSNRPGIGYKYFEQNKDKIYLEDSVLMRDTKKVWRQKPFKYFDRKMAEVNSEFMRELKQKRKELAISQKENHLGAGDLGFVQDLVEQQRQLLKKLRLLNRKL